MYSKPKGFNLCIFNDSPQHELAFDSRLDDKMTYSKLNDSTIILYLGKYLFVRKTNFCKKCMKTVKDVLNHVCLSQSLCIKCYSDCKSSNCLQDNSTKCPLCDIYFYRETCLSGHTKKQPSLQVNKLSTCQLFKYCNDCNSIVRRFCFNNDGQKKNTTVARDYTA